MRTSPRNGWPRDSCPPVDLQKRSSAPPYGIVRQALRPVIPEPGFEHGDSVSMLTLAPLSKLRYAVMTAAGNVDNGPSLASPGTDIGLAANWVHVDSSGTGRADRVIELEPLQGGSGKLEFVGRQQEVKGIPDEWDSVKNEDLARRLRWDQALKTGVKYRGWTTRVARPYSGGWTVIIRSSPKS